MCEAINQENIQISPIEKKNSTSEHAKILISVVMCIFEWRTLGCCYFSRGAKTLQLTADDVNFLSEQNMQMKWTQLSKLLDRSRIGSQRTECLQQRGSPLLFTSPDCVCLRTNNCQEQERLFSCFWTNLLVFMWSSFMYKQRLNICIQCLT